MSKLLRLPLALAAALLAAAAPGAAQTLVFPFFVETPGTAASATYSFDTTLFFVSNRAPVLEIRLFELGTGLEMTGANGRRICDPCFVDFRQPRRHVEFKIEDAAIANGGGFRQRVNRGLIHIRISGGTFADVAVQAVLVNAHSSAFDLSITPLQGTVIPDALTNR